MINMKKQAFNAAAILALTASAASHAVYVDLPNGSFDGTADMGVFVDGGGGSTVSFETTGGNGGGFGLASNTGGGWGGGFVAVANAAEDPIALADYGLTGGDSVDIRFDLKDFNGDGAGATGIKMESWTASAGISNTGDVHFAQSDSNWNTITYNYTFDATATHFKAVLVGTNAGEVGFDNLQIDSAAAVPVPAAAWLFGSALAGLVAVRRKK